MEFINGHHISHPRFSEKSINRNLKTVHLNLISTAVIVRSLIHSMLVLRILGTFLLQIYNVITYNFTIWCYLEEDGSQVPLR